MIYPRVIPILLLSGDGLVKTINFDNEVYIGDPINAVRIFNEKEVDELVLLDIRATLNGCEPNYELIKEIVSESFMPVGYGGGINSIDVARKIFNCGVEKLIFNTSLLNFDLIKSLADIYGSQSIVACIDFRRNFWGGFNLYTHSGRIKIKYDLLDFVRKVIDVGVGEIILQSIDKEGTMKGYDLEALLKVTDIVEIPVVASGGAGDFSHFLDAIYKANSSAVAAGSLFVFKGSQKGILINYPKQSFLKELFNINFKN